jgi:hypothetical protein
MLEEIQIRSAILCFWELGRTCCKLVGDPRTYMGDCIVLFMFRDSIERRSLVRTLDLMFS